VSASTRRAGARLRYRFGSVELDADVPLPGFEHCRVPAGPGGTAFGFTLRRAAGPPAGGRLALRGRGRRLLEVWRRPDGGYLVTAGDAAPCTLEPDGRALSWHLGDGQPGPGDAEFVVATVLPRALTRQDVHVLHAATVLGPRGALLLCGPSGTGKSTTAAAVHRATGWPLLGDDAAVLGLAGGRAVVSSCSRDMRLWDDASGWLGLPPGAALARHGGKARHPLPGHASGPVPVAAVVRLVPGDGPGLGAPSPSRRLADLRDQLMRLDRTDPAALAREFAFLVALVRSVPVLRLHRRRQRATLPATVDRLTRLATEPARCASPTT
jgi:hypothetical protein